MVRQFRANWTLSFLKFVPTPMAPAHGTTPISVSFVMRSRSLGALADSSFPILLIRFHSTQRIHNFAWCHTASVDRTSFLLLRNSMGRSAKCGSSTNPTVLWTVRGSTNDPTIPNCALTQPDFEAEVRAGNLAFRIPLQMTGLGLIESIQDREILAQHDATAALRELLGIGGHPNRSGNDGTITRFGWKAQNKSITMFAGEAYNVEMGITNELFPTATEEDPDCNGPNKPLPNDVVRTDKNDHDNKAFDNPL